MLKPKSGSRKVQLKTVRVITEEQAHICNEKCFEPRKKRKPSDLRPVDLGYVYQDSQGRVYREWGEDDWLEVIGMNFLHGRGGLHIAFIPKEQLHIHSRGGRTTALMTEQHDDPGSVPYHAGAAAVIMKDEGKNLKQAREILGSEAAKVIPRAPKKKKPSSGRGRGAPGEPRSDRGRKIFDLINEGLSKADVLSRTITWAKESGESVAGPYGRTIKQHVDKVWARIKSRPK